MKWYRTCISWPLAERIKKIYLALGYTSIAQFVGSCVMEGIQKREREYDELRDDIDTGRRVKGTLKGDEGDLLSVPEGG